MSVPLGMVPSEIQEVDNMRKIVANVENMTLLDFIYLRNEKLARILEKEVWDYRVIMPIGLDDVPIMTVYVKEFEYSPNKMYQIPLV